MNEQLSVSQSGQKASSRKIIHIDMDCFYAAVEIRERPELAGKPVAIGGAADRRGVLATCNYEARRFGVRSAMPTSEALKRCPELILVKGNMSLYQDISAQIREIFARYTDLIEPLSLDEAFLDVTNVDILQGSATLIADAIRKDIERETGLTASAGVAPCKFLAKIASDENKPNGMCVIRPQDVAGFVKGLSLAKIPGVGKKTVERLALLGLETCADVQKISLQRLSEQFGAMGESLWYKSHGVDNRQVETHRESKSVSVENTFEKDLRVASECQDAMQALVPDLYRRLNKHLLKKQIRSVKVKIKFADFQQTTVEQACEQWQPELFAILLQRALQRYPNKAVRLIGIGVGLEPMSQQHQFSLAI